MRRLKSICFLSIGAVLLVGCAQSRIDTQAEAEKLGRLSREWSQAASSRDVEKILSYWSDDAVVVSSGEAMRKGKKSIRQMVEGSMKNPGFHISWEPIHVEVSAAGDMGYALEETKISTTDLTGKSVEMMFNGVTIWKRQADGNWRNVVDVLSPKEKQH
jgi:uncharacterized protein (TIGR02246 family)